MAEFFNADFSIALAALRMSPCLYISYTAAKGYFNCRLYRCNKRLSCRDVYYFYFEWYLKAHTWTNVFCNIMTFLQ